MTTTPHHQLPSGTRSHTTPRPARPRRGAFFGTVGVLAVGTTIAGASLFAGPAAASNPEFPANPNFRINFECRDNQPSHVQLILTNIGGKDRAVFTVDVTGEATKTVNIDPDEVAVVSDVDLPEGVLTHYEAHVRADDGFEGSFVDDPTPDCFQYAGELAIVCDGRLPRLDAVIRQGRGSADTDIAFRVDGDLVESGIVQAEEHRSTPLEDGQAFSATLSNAFDGTFATLTGRADCTPDAPAPDPEPPTTEPEEPPTPQPAPGPEAPAEPAPPSRATPAPSPDAAVAARPDAPAAPVAAPAAAPTELPRTGSATGPLAALGALLLSSGTFVARFARRLA